MGSKKMKLNLGCGKDIKSEYINLDMRKIKGISLVCNLEIFPYPFQDAVFDEIYCNNVLEHLDDIVGVMDELHRICKPGARIVIKIPHFTSQYAFADPTHKHYFTYESFDYFTSAYEMTSECPDWYSERKFNMFSKKIIFSKGLLLPWNYMLEWFFNKTPKYYEGTFLRMFPAESMLIILEVKKTLLEDDICEYLLESILKMEEVNCNLCGADNHRLVMEVSDQHPETDTKFKIVECNNCGLIFTNPRPNKTEIKSYYTSDYYENKDFTITYNNIKIKGAPFVVRSYFKFRNKLERNKLFEKVKRVENNIGRQGKIVDVGCGNGDFLGLMELRDWQCLGIEISDFMSEYAMQKYGIDVFNGELEEANLLPDSVDVITFWHSLEHLYDPIKTLRGSYEILKKNGLIIILVPDIESYEFMVLKEKWPHLDVPRHLYHWSERTLTNLLKKTGFRDISLSHFTKLSMNHFKLLIWPEHWDRIRLGKEGKSHSYVFCIKVIYELLHYISLPLSLIASLFGHGHSIVIYARK
jgi:predicted SAM-dependent methyltransferase